MNTFKLNKKSAILSSILILLFLSFSSCSEESNDPIRVNDEFIINLGEQLTRLQEYEKKADNEGWYGFNKGQYPEESRIILKEGVEGVAVLVWEAANGELSGSQAELVNKVKEMVDSVIVEFESTVRIEDQEKPSQKAELFVYGEDNGYIDFGTHPEYTNFGELGNQQFTVELWMKITKTAGFGCVVSTFLEEPDASPSYRKGWMINHFNNDYMRMSYANVEYHSLWEPGSAFTDIDKWVHVAAVYNDNGVDGEVNDGKTKVVKVYFNGEEVNSVESANPINEHYNYKDSDGKKIPMTAFLAYDREGQKIRPINGSIKHFHIWKSAKSQEEIKDIMNGVVEVVGTENDLVCGWELDQTVNNVQKIPDLTGKFNAELKGEYKWVIID